MTSVTTRESLDNIVEHGEDPQSNVLHESQLTMNSMDTVFEVEPKVPDSVVKITPSIFTWGSDENTLVVNDLTFPRGKQSKSKFPERPNV